MPGRVGPRSHGTGLEDIRAWKYTNLLPVELHYFIHMGILSIIVAVDALSGGGVVPSDTAW